MKELDQKDLEQVEGAGLARLAVKVVVAILAELATSDVAHAPTKPAAQ
jgi:hypothetical protein